MPSYVIKLSSRATNDFWAIPVLFEDEHLLALDKPAGMPVAPDTNLPDQPSLMALLHAGIVGGKAWAQERGLDFLRNVHRLDSDASGVLLLAKSKQVLRSLADFFGGENSGMIFVALVHGNPAEDRFEVDAKLAPRSGQPGVMRVDAANGKRARTRFEVLEKFTRNALLRCEPATLRPHQIRLHLNHVGLRVAGDSLYGGKPLWLSRLKRDYRLKEGREERPLISRAALHAEQITLPHPVKGETLTITAPWPKDLRVAVKYLRQYAKPVGCGAVVSSF